MSMNERVLYELAAADPQLRFSPYCWRVRLALLHKGLAVRTVAWRFTEKEMIAFAGTDKVPVLVDGSRVVHDSWRIAEYLDEAYPAAPLFGDAAARGTARFVARWIESEIQPRMLRMIALDIHSRLDARDRDYFRRTREARLGETLEALHASRETRLPALRAALEPLRRTLAEQPFVAGAAPRFADYAVFGAFQWARLMSEVPLIEPDDPLTAWRARMLETFGASIQA
jgi:glutathione S-transferase